MTTNIEAPGRSALWTEAALRCLAALAVHARHSENPEGKRAGVVEDAFAYATAFEAACIAVHAEEQAAKRAAKAAQFEADKAAVLKQRYYLIHDRDLRPVRLTVREVDREGVVRFDDAAGTSASLADVVMGEGIEPWPADEPMPAAG